MSKTHRDSKSRQSLEGLVRTYSKKSWGWPKPLTRGAVKDSDDEALPTHVGIHHGVRSARSGYGGFRTPAMRRWLRSHVGQDWGQVYSKLRAKFDVRTDLGQSGLESTLNIVDIHGLWKDEAGEVWASGRYTSYKVGGFYVDPETGIFCEASQNEPRYRAQSLNQKDYLVLSESVQLHCKDGIWYEVTLAKLPDFKPEMLSFQRFRYDMLHRQSVLGPSAYDSQTRYGDSTVYAKSKRQLSSAELLKHGLRNGETQVKAAA